MKLRNSDKGRSRPVSALRGAQVPSTAASASAQRAAPLAMLGLGACAALARRKHRKAGQLDKCRGSSD